MKNFKSKIVIAIFSILLVFSIFVFIPHRDKDNDNENVIKQELIENKGKYDEQKIVLQNTSKVEAKELAKRLGASLRITKDGTFATLTLPSGTTIQDVVNNPENKDIIDKFSLDYKASVSETEEIEDKYLPKPSKVTPMDEFYTSQTYLDYLNLSNVWEYTKGENITIAVIDSGIDTDHPEFEGKISEYSYNATEDKIVKDYTDENGNYDWSLVEDERGHGTAVTGVIAASWDNGGIVGIAPNVTVITIKAKCDEKGQFSESDLVFGLYYAIERDVDIVNMSFGGQGSKNAFAEATRLAVDSDIICVASAGNDSTAALQYPAADPNVISVGALAYDSYELADYSNYGENVNVVAPGTVYTTSIDGEYKIMNGTSFASPIVAACLALQKAYDKTYRGEYYQEFTFTQELLYASSIDIGDLGEDFYYGYGAIDVNNLVLEERKTVTFNYLTDEIDTTYQVFIKGHPLQNIPEPERLYAVFDGWYYDIHCFEEYQLYIESWQNDITLYCNWGNEDDVLPYTYVELEDGTIEIRSYTGKRRYITIPEYIDGKVVSSIGRSAFENQTRLRVVNLPAQLKIIKDNAFANCINLTSITIPDSVLSIGAYAFYNNIRIYNVNFGFDSKLEIIKTATFQNCSNLSRIDLPENVVFSEQNDYCTGNAFLGCTNLKQINAHKKSKYFSSKDGLLFNKSKTTLVLYPAGLTNDTYDLPKSVKKLGVSSFAFSKIETIDLKNVIMIDDGTFQYSKIENIVIPDGVTYIGASAFAHSYISSIELGHGISEISEGCFCNTSNLKEIIIPNSVIEIDVNAFSSSKIENVYFEENSTLQSIGDWSFANSNIKRIDLPNSVISIGEYAFRDSRLKILNILEDSNLVNIDSFAFALTNISYIYLPSKLTTIGSFAFELTNLSEVIIPASIINYEPSAFASCYYLENIFVEEENDYFLDIDGVVYTKNLKTIHEYPAGKKVTNYTILSTVEKIGEHAFHGSWNLNNVVLSDKLIEVDEYGFYDCINITVYYLPETLQVIQEYAFANNKSLYGLDIPDNVIQISNCAFKNNYNMLYVNLSNNSKLDRLAYESFAYCGIYSFRVPSNVSTIPQNVFIGCTNLNSVTFASNSQLESVGAYLFKGCNNLREINFEEGSLLTNIVAHAFEGMSNLQFINFGDAKITNIDNFAFRYCESLQEITIPNTVEYIGRYSFFGCKSLSRIDIPSSVEYIGRYAFNLTNELDVYFENTLLPLYIQENWDYGIRGYYLGVKEIYTDGDYELAKLTNDTIAIIKYNGEDKNIDLTSLNFGVITQIGGSAFRYSSIESITLPETIVTIDKYAFANTNLKTVNIPSSIIQIGDSAFRNSKIENINFESGSSLNKIGMYAFANTTLLKSISIPESLLSLGSYTFFESGLEEIIFDENINLQTINESTFQKSKLINITIPNSVTLIDHNAFRDIPTLQNVNFGTGQLQIMSNVFYNTGLINISIPENVEYIGEFAFVGLKQLDSFSVDENNRYYASKDGVLYSKDYKKLISFPGNKGGTYTIPETVEEIGFGAFENSKLTNVYFGENINLLTLGYRAFYNSSIESIILPKTLVSIDYYALAMCKNLKTVEFDKETKLTGIYEGAFYGCINLENIVIPDEIYEISEYAFYGCLSLEKLPISESNKIFGIYDYAFANSGITELNLPESLLDIGNYAFQGIKAKEIIVPTTNQKQLIIGLGAFNECNELENITLPFIGTSFETEKFFWIGYVFGSESVVNNNLYVPEKLKKIIISEGQTCIFGQSFSGFAVDEIDFPYSITLIYENALTGVSARYKFKNEITTPYGYIDMSWLGTGLNGTLKIKNDITYLFSSHTPGNELKGVIIPDSVTNIGQYSFSGCTSLENITIPSSVENIGQYSFSGCTSLKNITIPNSIENIERYAFSGCTNLEEVIFEENSILNGISPYAFSDCTSLKHINLPQSIRGIANGAFYNCTSLKHIDLPQSLNRIGPSAFSNCSSLVSIIIPNNISYIEEFAFSNCLSLTIVELSSKLNQIGAWAFQETNVTIIKVNNDFSINFSSTEHGEIAKNCKVIIDKNGNYVYDSSVSDYIEKDDYVYIKENDKYKMIAYLGTNDTVTLPLLINNEQYDIYKLRGVTNVIIPEGIEGISENAFFNCKTLKTLTLPNTLREIGAQAFNGCAITIKGNDIFAYVNHILWKNNKEIIYINPNAEEVILPSNMTSISDKMFFNFNLSSTLIIPKSVTTIGEQAFSNSTFKAILFENGSNLKEIKYQAFSNCSINKISLPKSLEYIGVEAFKDSSIREIIFSSEKLKIDESAFDNCYKLREVYINGKFEKWLHYEFTDILSTPMSQANEIYEMGENNTYKKVREIVVPNTVTCLGKYQFYGFDYFSYFELNKSVKYIAENTFYSVYIEDFYYNGNIEDWCNIEIHNYNSTIGNIYILDNDSEYYIPKEIVIPSTVNKIGDYQFKNFGDVISVIVPNTVTHIGSYAFIDCYNLTNIEIPNSVTHIGSYAFSGCHNLKNVIIDENSDLTNIGLYSFGGCLSLESFLLPKNLLNIEDYAFQNTNIKRIINASDLIIELNSINNGGIALNAEEIINKDGSIISADETFIENNFLFKEKDDLIILMEYLGTEETITLPETAKGNEYSIGSVIGAKNVIIPDRIKNLYSYSFDNCNTLKSITISNTVELIEEGMGFSIAGVIDIYFRGTIEDWVEINITGFIVPYNLFVLDENGDYYEPVNISIPETVNTVKSYSFSNCLNVENIFVPNTISDIGNSAFDSPSIKKIEFEQNENIINLNSRCFAQAQEVILPKLFKLKGSECFSNICKIYYNGGVHDWLNLTFENSFCNPSYYSSEIYMLNDSEEYEILKNIQIPLYVRNIGNYQFFNFDNLTTIELSRTVVEIGNYAFSDCDNLAKFLILNSVRTIGDYAFSNCDKLEVFEIEKFSQILKLENETILSESNVKRVLLNEFSGNILSSFFSQIHVDTERTDNVAFMNDIAMSAANTDRVVFPDNINYCEYNIFSYHNHIKELEIAGNANLSNCVSLRKIIIKNMNLYRANPDSDIKYLFDSVFPFTLEVVVLKDGVEVKSENLFKDISNVKIFVDQYETDIMWDHDYPGWNNGNKVYYKGEWITTKFYDSKDNLISQEYYLTSQIIRQPILNSYIENGYTYSFVGWDIDGDGLADSYPATSNIDIVAKAVYEKEINTYKVNYYDKDNSTILYQIEYQYGDVLTLIDSPIKKGYNFISWEGYPTDFIVTSNINIYSIWEHQGDGHKYDIYENINPTCIDKGYKKNICSICDEWYATEYIDALGHTYIHSTIDPTCVERGYDLHSCSCGHIYKDNYVSELGHNFTEWIIDQDSTCTEEGTKYRNCECGYVEIQKIELKEHEYESEIIKDSTCEEIGSIRYTCNVCNDIYEEEIPLSEHKYHKKYVSLSWIEIIIKIIKTLLFGYEGERAYYWECIDCGHIKTNEDKNNQAVSVAGACGHKEVTWYVASESNCLQEGIKYSKCSECNILISFETTVALGHNYEVVVTAPTCTEQGYTTYTCHCGDSYISDYVDALGHTEVIDKAVEPTCTETGLTEGKHCSVCNEVLVKQEVVEALGHSYSEWKVVKEPTEEETGLKQKVCSCCDDIIEETIPTLTHAHNYEVVVKSPTCTEQGYTTYICHCGDSYISDYVDALGHTEVIDEKVEPTCTTTGLTEGKHCSVCKEVLVKQEVVEALGHEYEAVVTNPTCTEQGYTTYTCHCGDSYISDYVDALGHNHEVMITSPTCTEQGYTTYTCHCGDSYISDYVDALGHSYSEWKVVKEPTEEETGLQQKVCSNCNDIIEQIIPALTHAHNYEVVVTSPTCTEQGYTTYTCHCGDSYISDYVDALGHNHEVIITSPTCTEQGYTTYTCSCGDSYVSDYVDALGHTEVIDEKAEPTCTTNGLTEGKHCSVCNEVLVKQEVVEALGHNYKAIITAPTCTEQGYTTYICHCGDSYISNYVNALGHNVVIDEKVAPTCTTNGLTEGKHCSVCNEVLVKQNIIKATGHDYTTVVTKPKCQERGYTTYTCHCGYSYISDYVSFLGHDMIVKPEVAPTCTTSGLTKGGHCSRCDYVDEQEVIPATGHNYTDYVIEQKPTCAEEGIQRIYCHDCDDYIEEKIPLRDHKESDWILDKAPTKTEKGHEHTECLECKKILQEADIEKLEGGCASKAQAMLMVYTVLMTSLIYVFRKRR